MRFVWLEMMLLVFSVIRCCMFLGLFMVYIWILILC